MSGDLAAVEQQAPALVQDMVARGLTMGSCESLTGGLLAATITSVPGASATFRGALVTYASDLKCSLVGLEPDLVAQQGVINAHTARTMATGARRQLSCDVAIACTGVAGPEAQDGAAVGTVWLAVAGPDGVRDQLLQLRGDRARIREQTVAAGLALVRDWLSEHPALVGRPVQNPCSHEDPTPK